MISEDLKPRPRRGRPPNQIKKVEITISLPPDVAGQLDKLSREIKKGKGEIVADALRGHFSSLS
jgi:hypothetical protein